MPRIENFLVKADNICDYIPIVSTATNLVDLFQKTVLMPKLDAEDTSKNEYFTHLKSKKLARCFALLFPFIGNMFIAICDFRNQPGMKAFLDQAKIEIEFSRKRFAPFEFYTKRF